MCESTDIIRYRNRKVVNEVKPQRVRDAKSWGRLCARIQSNCYFISKNYKYQTTSHLKYKKATRELVVLVDVLRLRVTITVTFVGINRNT